MTCLAVMRLSWLVTLCWYATSMQARCPTNVLVMYHMVLQTDWSVEKFPKQYPEWRPPAQWSVVVGRSHNSTGVLWRAGQTASDSVEQFVETGKAEKLIQEKQKADILSEFFAPPILQGVGRTRTNFFADARHSKVSMICRIVPSPDWFIGVDSFDLCRNDNWTDAVTLALGPLDGGTENGYTFTSPKWATVPKSPITSIASRSPDHPASSFFYPELKELPAIATVTFLKLKEFSLSKQLFRDFDEAMERKTERKHPKKKKLELSRSPLSEKEPPSRTARKEPTSKKRKRSRLCKVSEWSDWGACSSSCGFGEQIRRRHVTHLTKEGRPCPPLQESKWCRHADSCQNSSTEFFRWQ